MSMGKARLLLASIISVRASAFLFSKLLLVNMGPFTLMGIRFLLAFALLALVFRKRFRNMTRHVFLGGLAAGLAFFATMSFELNALRCADSSTVAFLENTAIVLVPIAAAVMAKRLPGFKTALAAVVALVGVGCLTLGRSGLHLGTGEALAMGAAVCYTAAMIVTDRFSKEGDVILIGVLQVGWIGALGLVCSFLFETPALPATGAEWAFLAVLIVACTGFGFTLQPMAQKPLPVSDVSLMCAISPVVAAVLGVLVLSEQVDLMAIAGMALVFASIVISSVPSPRKVPIQGCLVERRESE